MGKSVQVMRKMEHKAQLSPKRLVFAEGEHPKIIRAAYAVATQGIAQPMLLGRADEIIATVREAGAGLCAPRSINPTQSTAPTPMRETFHDRRQRKGVTLTSGPRPACASPTTSAR